MPIAAHMNDNSQAFEASLKMIGREEFRNILRRNYANDGNAAEIAVLVEKLIGWKMDQIDSRLDRLEKYQKRHGKLLIALCEKLGVDWKIIWENDSDENEIE